MALLPVWRGHPTVSYSRPRVSNREPAESNHQTIKCSKLIAQRFTLSAISSAPRWAAASRNVTRRVHDTSGAHLMSRTHQLSTLGSSANGDTGSVDHIDGGARRIDGELLLAPSE